MQFAAAAIFDIGGAHDFDPSVKEIFRRQAAPWRAAPRRLFTRAVEIGYAKPIETPFRLMAKVCFMPSTSP